MAVPTVITRRVRALVPGHALEVVGRDVAGDAAAEIESAIGRIAEVESEPNARIGTLLSCAPEAHERAGGHSRRSGRGVHGEGDPAAE